MSPSVPRPGDILRAASGRDYRLQAWHAEGSYARVFRAEVASRPAGGALGARRSALGAKGPFLPRAESREPRAAEQSEGMCAIKLAKAEVAGAAERLTREAETRRRFQHLQVPELLDTGCAGEQPFLALSWIEGPTLRSMVERQRRLPLVVALSLLHDVAAVTGQMHAGGLAHGDLRAENILVASEDGRTRAVVTDLGEAPRRGEPEFDAAVINDVGRLAELLYFMLTGSVAARDPGRLSAAHGHHPAAVRLWETAARGALTAPAFLREVEALQRSINGRL
jgi:serine/threonine protein kinase